MHVWIRTSLFLSFEIRGNAKAKSPFTTVLLDGDKQILEVLLSHNHLLQNYNSELLTDIICLLFFYLLTLKRNGKEVGILKKKRGERYGYSMEGYRSNFARKSFTFHTVLLYHR